MSETNSYGTDSGMSSMGLKILYFLDFPFSVGGSNKVLLTQAHIMQKRGCQALVVIPNDREGYHAVEYDRICETYSLRTAAVYFSVATCMEEIDILKAMENAEAIKNIAAAFNPDLIHSTQINIAVELAARSLGMPHIMNIYQADKEEFAIKWMDIYPRYHSADSEVFSARWGEGLQISSRCIRVACEGSHRDDGQNRERKHVAPIRLLSIGVIYQAKNQLEIIKFVLKCKNDGIKVKLTILGNDTLPYGLQCKEFVAENDLEEEVIFKGFVSNVKDYFSHADLLIVASTVESYPGVIVESMANGVPVLSTPVAGVPELLQDGYNGILTKGYGCEDIYEAFDRYLAHKKEIKNMINHAYDTCQRYHSYEAVGARLEDYYHWVIQDYENNGMATSPDTLKNIFNKFVEETVGEQAGRFTKAHIWYLYHLNEKLKKNNVKKIVIWGAGYMGEMALKWMELLCIDDRVIGFLDTYKKGEYLSYPILEEKEQIIKSCDMILVANGDAESRLEIMAFLEKYDKKRNRDYFMVLNGPIRI